MHKGVIIVDPLSTYVESGAQIGSGIIINPNTFIGRHVVVGKDCRIGSFTILNEIINVADGCEIGYMPRYA